MFNGVLKLIQRVLLHNNEFVPNSLALTWDMSYLG